MHEIPKLKCFNLSSHLTVVFAQSIEASCWIEIKDVVGAVSTDVVFYLFLLDRKALTEWLFLE